MKKQWIFGTLLVLAVGCDVVLGIDQPTSVLPDTKCRAWKCEGQPCHYEFANAGLECDEGFCDGAGECKFDVGHACQNPDECYSGVCVKSGNGYVCGKSECNGPNQQYDAQGKCVTKDGIPCEKDEECLSGHCSDNVCCDKACAETCMTCDLNEETRGTCVFVGVNEQDDESAQGLCNSNGASCDGKGQCNRPNGELCSTNSDCRSGYCTDGYCCNEECSTPCTACNLAPGICSHVPFGAPDNFPLAVCTGQGEACDGKGNCAKMDGQICFNHGECVSGHCIDGVCCDTKCDGTCFACTAKRKGEGFDGYCGPIAKDMDPDNECSNGACYGNGACGKYNGETCVANDECLSKTCGVDAQGVKVCLGASCNGLPANCDGNRNCCASALVSGGTFYLRLNPAEEHKRTVSSFRMDAYEVTVGRFRKFVEAYPNSKPIAGAGKHPKIANSGWQTAWDSSLPATLNDLKNELVNILKCSAPTWTTSEGANELRPINCVSWELAFAFCAWDGGRLPTEAEWNFAAARGANYLFPWNQGGQVEPGYAVYNCQDGGDPTSCVLNDINFVGMKYDNGGPQPFADLVGNVAEWTLDRNGPISGPCTDCANLSNGTGNVLRGGSWRSGSYGTNIAELQNNSISGIKYKDTFGIRCAAP